MTLKILLTNDDGVFAPGISIMAAHLHMEGFDYLTLAPGRERSSVGHAITLHRPLRLWEVDNGPYPSEHKTYACDGTPSDSVVLGLEEMAPDTSLVVSGINRGPNVADDVTYSGTVSAAMEGVIMGRPAVAVSLDCHREDEVYYYDTAARVLCRVVHWLGTHVLKEGVLLNINVPNLPYDELKGIKVTRKGVRKYHGKVNKMYDPHGRLFYWVSGRPEDELVEGCDVWALSVNCVSVTPIQMDMTCYESVSSSTVKDLETILE